MHPNVADHLPRPAPLPKALTMLYDESFLTGNVWRQLSCLPVVAPKPTNVNLGFPDTPRAQLPPGSLALVMDVSASYNMKWEAYDNLPANSPTMDFIFPISVIERFHKHSLVEGTAGDVENVVRNILRIHNQKGAGKLRVFRQSFTDDAPMKALEVLAEKNGVPHPDPEMTLVKQRCLCAAV